MKITSAAFEHNQLIPKKYTCQGKNLNPPLQFVDVPQTAKSLVLIVDDPDAPSKTWVHWILYNIDPMIKEISEDSVPANTREGMTDSGYVYYGGPCPPSGTHRYLFKLYALDTTVSLEGEPVKAIVEAHMKNHIIEKAELVGLYKKS